MPLISYGIELWYGAPKTVPDRIVISKDGKGIKSVAV